MTAMAVRADVADEASRMTSMAVRAAVADEASR